MIHRLSYIFLYTIALANAASAVFQYYREKMLSFAVILQLITAIVTIISISFVKSRENTERIESYLSLKLTVFIIMYAISIPFCGYLLSTTIFVYLISRDYSVNWTDCMLTALISSLIIYSFFLYGLHFTPPLGKLFTFMGGALW